MRGESGGGSAAYSKAIKRLLESHADARQHNRYFEGERRDHYLATLKRHSWIGAVLILLLVTAVACAPATNGPVVGVEGIDVGNTSPPFAMTLTDGSEVSLKDIVDDNQPTHLFWFATW